MEIEKIKKSINDSWSETSAKWNDQYAVRFEKSIIVNLENILDEIQESSNKLEENFEETIDKIKKIENEDYRW